MRLRPLLGLIPALASLTIYACVGDDSLPTTSPATPDASSGIDGATSADAETKDVATPIGDSATTDASDGATDFDAGPPAWTSNLASGPISILVNAGDKLCRFEVVSVQTALGPPQYSMYLRKGDAPAAICNEPKGIRALGTGYSLPTASLLKTQATRHLVLAYSSKLSLSGSSPILLRMSQVDWATGNDIHVALTKTKAVVGIPMVPSLDVTLLFFGDPTEEAAGTVRLKGTGTFPGESGAGAFFYATYVNFVGSVGQTPAAADTCLRAD